MTGAKDFLRMNDISKSQGGSAGKVGLTRFGHSDFPFYEDHVAAGIHWTLDLESSAAYRAPFCSLAAEKVSLAKTKQEKNGRRVSSKGLVSRHRRPWSLRIQCMARAVVLPPACRVSDPQEQASQDTRSP